MGAAVISRLLGGFRFLDSFCGVSMTRTRICWDSTTALLPVWKHVGGGLSHRRIFLSKGGKTASTFFVRLPFARQVLLDIFSQASWSGRLNPINSGAPSPAPQCPNQMLKPALLDQEKGTPTPKQRYRQAWQKAYKGWYL